ncbi:MAG: cupin domain-containing protein [Candidatus Rokubacteria bacterium]|nr:cupin domain-containing protein [Candidatus Rokubacteria bacterium]
MPFIDWEQVPAEKVAEGITRKMVTGERLSFVLWRFAAGLHVPAHRHPNEQIAYMIRGKMEFRLGDERRTLSRPGEILLVPANVEHEAWFPEETEVVDVFSPPREDFLTGRDDYLRRG